MKSKEIDDKNIHNGHRQRLMETAIEAGLIGMSKIQVVELMLFFIIPRRDVNPIAHRLLNKFGTITNIFEASVVELMQVKGITKTSANKIRVLNEIGIMKNYESLQRRQLLSNYDDMADYVEELLRTLDVEHFLMIALDKSFRVVDKRFIKADSIASVELQPLKLATFLTSAKPAHIILAHNHPGGSCVPSKRDMMSNSGFEELLTKLNVRFIDHLIVGNDGVYSCYKNFNLRDPKMLKGERPKEGFPKVPQEN